MRYLWSVIVGVVGAVLASVIWVLFRGFVANLEISRQMQASGGGGIGAVVVVTEVSVLAAALAGFLGGFFWYFRRASRIRQSR
jgi:hypothetical protein